METEGNDLSSVPSWHRFAIAADSVINALEIEDPEETLMVQLTLPELAVVMLGINSVAYHYPELGLLLCQRLSDKIRALTAGQEYFERINEKDETDE